MTSADGTRIAVTCEGTGPAVVLVGGGLDDGAENAPLATALSRWFTVYNYSRRGRGGSGDIQPYAVAQEIEDLGAVITLAGGAAHVHGVSSGGALALRAAAAGVPIARLSVYEVPYPVGDEAVAVWREYVEHLKAVLTRGDPDGALRLFMRLAGAGEDDITAAASSPAWPGLLAIAHTLAYDAACLGDGEPRAEELARVPQPTLVATGTAPDPRMRGYFDTAADVVAANVPNATRKVVKGQSHVADPAAMALVLKEFFSAR